MSYIAYNPEEEYVGNPEEILPQSEGTTFFISEGTTISGAEIVDTETTVIKTVKTKLFKKNIEKPKALKKTTTLSQPKASTPPVETFFSND